MHSIPQTIIIVATGRNREIGAGGDLLWHLSGDLRRFKELTMGYPVVMGRKTWESLPKKPLTGRDNIVISRNSNYNAPGARLASSLPEALEIAAQTGAEKIFIIGGASVYREAVGYADTIDLTFVDADFPQADTFFPEILDGEWEIAEESAPVTDPKSGLTYQHRTLRCVNR